MREVALARPPKGQRVRSKVQSGAQPNIVKLSYRVQT